MYKMNGLFLTLVAVVGISLAAPRPGNLGDHLREFDTQIDKALSVVYDFFGQNSATDLQKPSVLKSEDLEDDLMDELDDLYDLVPIDEVQLIFAEHLISDSAFGSLIVYMQGTEWETFVNKKPVQDLIKYLVDSGLPVNDSLEEDQDFLRKIVPGTIPDDNGSLRPLMEELLKVIPVRDILDLLHIKLRYSPAIQELYLRISNQEFNDIVNRVISVPECQKFIVRMRKFDLPIDDVLSVSYAFFGWDDAPVLPKTIETESLVNEMGDIPDLVLLKKIEQIVDNVGEIFDKHFAKDSDSNYMNLVNDIGARPEVKRFVNHLKDSDELWNGAHNLVQNENRGLRVSDKQEMLPSSQFLDVMKAKLQDNGSFQNLYLIISSQRGQDLAARIWDNISKFLNTPNTSETTLRFSV